MSLYKVISSKVLENGQGTFWKINLASSLLLFAQCMLSTLCNVLVDPFHTSHDVTASLTSLYIHSCFSHFWGAKGAPILFSEIGFCVASCSYIYVTVEVRKRTLYRKLILRKWRLKFSNDFDVILVVVLDNQWYDCKTFNGHSVRLCFVCVRRCID